MKACPKPHALISSASTCDFLIFLRYTNMYLLTELLTYLFTSSCLVVQDSLLKLSKLLMLAMEPHWLIEAFWLCGP